MPREWFPDIFFLQVDDTITGICLTVIAIVAAIWGTAAISTAWENCERENWRRWWHPRRWWPVCFSFRLGIFLVLSDAGIYGILGLQILRSREGIDSWAFLYIVLCVVAALWAFKGWAEERTSQEGEK